MRFRSAALSTVVVAATLTLAATVPAGASTQTTIYDCTDGQICLYPDPNFSTGSAGYFGAWAVNGGSSFGNLPVPNLHDSAPLMDDKASSGLNNSDQQVCAYADPNYQGNWIVFPPHTQLADFRTAGLDDQVTSIRVC